MNVFQFPYEYEEERKKQANDTVQWARNQSQQKTNEIRQGSFVEPKKPGLKIYSVLFAIGLVVYILSIIIDMISYGAEASGAGDICLKGFGFFVATYIIGGVIYFFLIPTDRAQESKAEGDNRLKQIDLENEEKNRLDHQISEIYREAEDDCKNYYEAFESAARKESVKYADSSYVKAVLEWMVYDKEANGSEQKKRRIIETPFTFGVYANKVACQFGTYDFFSNRQSNLSSPIEQAAFARAIAMGMMGIIAIINIDRDTGVKPVPDVTYTYKNSIAIAKIDIPFEEW